MNESTAFNPESHLAEALGRLQGIDDSRLKEVMEAFTRHAFAFINEVRPSGAEWLQGIEFLTAVGQKCDDERQEFILMSDTLGITMLMDHWNHGGAADDGATESSVLGLFHREGAPVYQPGESISLDGKGAQTLIQGRVLDTAGNAVAGAKLDIWQTAPNGFYETQDEEQPDYNLRGIFHSGEDGSYAFRTVKPVSYPVPGDGPAGDLLRACGRHYFRPAHVHIIVSAEGYAPVVTQLFSDDDDYLHSDTVFGVKDSLIVPFKPDGNGFRVDYDLVLRANGQTT